MKQSRFLQWFVFDWPVKVLSLLTAVLIFFLVQMLMIEERSFIVPLHVITGEEYYISSSYDQRVKVVITGDREDVLMVYPEDLYVMADASEITEEGMSDIPLSLRKSGLLDSMKNVDILIEPDEVRLQILERE